MTLSKTVMLAGIFMLTACSNSSSLNTANEIQEMSVPVVHEQNSTAVNNRDVTNCYKDNAQRLSKLQFSLKSHLGEDVSPSEIFDTHSDAHRVYVALSKLEQISAMNETYHKEGNVAGLKAINEMLKPVNVAA
ncbi:hypothetical protein ACLBW2_16240 [Enterobacteriaceae bacterium C23F]